MNNSFWGDSTVIVFVNIEQLEGHLSFFFFKFPFFQEQYVDHMNISSNTIRYKPHFTANLTAKKEVLQQKQVEEITTHLS